MDLEKRLANLESRVNALEFYAIIKGWNLKELDGLKKKLLSEIKEGE